MEHALRWRSVLLDVRLSRSQPFHLLRFLLGLLLEVLLRLLGTLFFEFLGLLVLK
jgi:hypothetical protein